MMRSVGLLNICFPCFQGAFNLLLVLTHVAVAINHQSAVPCIPWEGLWDELPLNCGTSQFWGDDCNSHEVRKPL